MSTKKLIESLLDINGIVIIASFKDDELSTTYLDRLYTKDEVATVFVNEGDREPKVKQLVFSSKPTKEIDVYTDQHTVTEAVTDALKNGNFVYWVPGLAIEPVSKFGINPDSKNWWIKWVIIFLVVLIVLFVAYKQFGASLFTNEV